MLAKKPKELRHSDLVSKIDFSKLKIKSSDDAPPCTSIIGQERAIKSIKLGLKIASRGYNIFVTGLTGTGRSTTIKHLLEELNTGRPELKDICYINNFRNPDNPVALIFKAGEGWEFKRDMKYTMTTLRKSIPKIFMSEDYKTRRGRIVSTIRPRRVL